MIKYKVRVYEKNKTVLNDYIKEIDLRVSTGLFSSYKFQIKDFKYH